MNLVYCNKSELHSNFTMSKYYKQTGKRKLGELASILELYLWLMIGSFFQNKSHQTYEAKLAKQIRQQQETERKSFSNLQKREYKLTKEQMKKVSDKKMDILQRACL